MRAVNLIPSELRRGGVGTPSRSGGAVYAVLGGLAVLVILVGAYVVAGNSVKSNRSQLAVVQAEQKSSEAEAASLKPYSDFATLAEDRTQTVSQLAASRFDWDKAMRQLARVLPASAQIQSLKGTVNPQVQLNDSSGGGGGDSATSAVRAASADPAIELSGCATSQIEVAQIISRLRLVDGVVRVTLVNSDKGADATGSTGTAASSNPSDPSQGCPTNRPAFGMVMFFAPAGGPANTPGSTARSAPVPSPPTSADLPAPTGPTDTTASDTNAHP
jgi:Tfp pilus assembly protein PilN